MIGLPKVCLYQVIFLTTLSVCKWDSRILAWLLPSRHAQDPIHIEDPLTNVVFKSITLKTVHGRRIFKDYEESEKMVAAGQ